MPAEAEVLDELRGLRARAPWLTGALAATVDGLVLAEDTGAQAPAQAQAYAGAQGAAHPWEPEPLAALTAAALGVAFRLNEASGRGAFRELLIHGELGYVATYAAGPSAVLTLLADDRINVGRLHLEGRRAAARIGELAVQALHAVGPPQERARRPASRTAAAGARTGARPPLERRRRKPPAS